MTRPCSRCEKRDRRRMAHEGLYAIELFPCSGGMAEGFRRAGILFAAAFDKDTDACDSYEQNLGHRPIHMDVRDLVRLARTGWRPSDAIDLLVADPPCTPWSRAGKRAGTNDDRDMLTDTCDLVRLLRPRAYLIGNIPGLDDSTQWPVVQRVIGGLARNGYCVADYLQLDAADYGVPQHRIRPFWFGHLDGPCLRPPAPTHGAPTDELAIIGCELEPWVTCRAALGHLSPKDLGRPVRLRWKPTDNHRPSDVDEPLKTITCNTHSDGSLLMRPHSYSETDAPARTITAGCRGAGGPAVLTLRSRGADNRRNGGDESRCSKLDEPARVITTRDSHKGGALLLANAKHPISRPDRPSMTVCARGDGRGTQGACVLEWPWDRPATAVMADERLPPPGHHGSDWRDKSTGERPRSGSNAIVLSERAAAILQGFPEGWVFSGRTKRARWSQLGQAMPPALAHAVATSVSAQLVASGLTAVSA